MGIEPCTQMGLRNARLNKESPILLLQDLSEHLMSQVPREGPGRECVVQLLSKICGHKKMTNKRKKQTKFVAIESLSYG